MDYPVYPIVAQGWQCPLCKRVYSPTTAMCFYCGSDNNAATTDITSKNGSQSSDDWLVDIHNIHYFSSTSAELNKTTENDNVN